MGVRLKSINFSDGSSTTNYLGADSYSMPAGRPSAAFTFEVGDPTGESIDMKTVVETRVEDYNELVEVAYKRLSNRLRRLASLADKIDANDAAKAAEQGA